MKKIAFLFLTKLDLIHDNLWKSFLDTAYINIYTHASDNKKKLSGVLKGTRIKNYQITSWGKTALAHQELIKAALADKDNYKFILFSESCVPLKSFSSFYSWITKNNDSLIKEDAIQGELIRVVKERIANTNLKFKDIHKHAANYCLNREHAQIIANADLKIYNQLENGDELFLSILWKNKINKITKIKNDWVVFSDWEYTQKKCDYYRKKAEQHYKKYSYYKNNKKFKEASYHKNQMRLMWNLVHDSAKHPRLFEVITDKIYKIIKPYYFARKFSKISNIEKYIIPEAGKYIIPRGGFPI